MAMVECKECQGKISSKARRCPHCGIRLSFSWWRTIFSILLGMVIVVLGFVVFVMIALANSCGQVDLSGISIIPMK